MNIDIPTIVKARQFGLLIAVVFLVFAGMHIHRSFVQSGLLAAAGIATAAIALMSPKVLIAPLGYWLRLGNLLQKIANPVIMGCLFLCVFCPLGLLMRVLGRTPLKLNLDNQATTYWVERPQPAPAPSSMKNGF